MRMLHQSNDYSNNQSSCNYIQWNTNHSINLARYHPRAAHPIRIALLDCVERCNHADLDIGCHGIIAEVDVQSQPWTTPEVVMDVCPVAYHSMDGWKFFCAHNSLKMGYHWRGCKILTITCSNLWRHDYSRDNIFILPTLHPNSNRNHCLKERGKRVPLSLKFLFSGTSLIFSIKESPII